MARNNKWKNERHRTVVHSTTTNLDMIITYVANTVQKWWERSFSRIPSSDKLDNGIKCIHQKTE